MIALVFSRRELAAKSLGIPTDPSSYDLAPGCRTCLGGAIRMVRRGCAHEAVRCEPDHPEAEPACCDCGHPKPSRCAGCAEFGELVAFDGPDGFCIGCAARLTAFVVGGES